MQKRYISFAVFFFAVLLVLFAHLCGRQMATPAFTFAEEMREVYLTFDDGPSTVVTNRILDTLKEENIKATFFIVGERIYGREETLRRIVREGHALGIHSNTHIYKEIYASDEAFLKDAQDCAKHIEKVSSVTPKLYRFPGGFYYEEKAKLLKEQGYEIVQWNAVCGDAETPNSDAETLVTTAIETSKGKRRVVLLMHDAASHTSTAEALPAIIAHFRAEGYTFKTF